LTLPKNVQTVREINFIEMPIADPMPITVRENAVTAKINPHQILTLAITFK